MAAKPSLAVSSGALDRLPPIAKVGVGFLFVVLVGLLYFVVFYGELSNDLSSAIAREDSLHDELKKAEASKDEYQKDLDEKTRRESQAREQKKILPDDPEMPSFLSSLQSVATNSGVSLTSWSPAEEMPSEFYAKVPMKLELVGKFHQVVKFFQSVGQIDRIINVENIKVKEPKIIGQDVEIHVDCLATAFRGLRPGETGAKRKGPAK
jgi:type IV pilus assembly protein PilO